MQNLRFRNRTEAGRELAGRLAVYADRPDTWVLGLPRGGVAVAFEVARTLNLPLDVFLVRKLGVPQYPELAMGAVATGGVRALNHQMIQDLSVPDELVDHVASEEQEELSRRERLYREGRPEPDVRGATVILVDDGLATGSTMYATVMALRQKKPARIVVAVPVAAPSTYGHFQDIVDEAICMITPHEFVAVGQWYEDFSQTTDDEVRELLKWAGAQTPAGNWLRRRAVQTGSLDRP
jgi:putative phosphoribosyl transferase